MHWPQFIIIAWWTIAFLYKSIAAIKDRDTSSEVAALAVVLMLGIYTGMAFVLHAGGFW